MLPSRGRRTLRVRCARAAGRRIHSPRARPRNGRGSVARRGRGGSGASAAPARRASAHCETCALSGARDAQPALPGLRPALQRHGGRAARGPSRASARRAACAARAALVRSAHGICRRRHARARVGATSFFSAKLRIKRPLPKLRAACASCDVLARWGRTRRVPFLRYSGAGAELASGMVWRARVLGEMLGAWSRSERSTAFSSLCS
ncbi:MC012 [Molluscum contagiosum virus subtype 2]|uniref:MC012 n=2 Tax=Molluscum contagiosum virus TaxID=10279 RepID=A0A1S7DLJ6_MCV2|nr:MC012 [Molluscum contagiosum virus subtype 2]QHW16395.1 MC012L [Molluscum contagiosum virus]AYO87644.1 MC012 [Molluscum contagiosum virus subtype 2]AYO87814.1 MC012 [Molluscum contagiosum virus subtype 2]AYO87984.1 MC012 [Molluscum contagiosum virus subtype 2]